MSKPPVYVIPVVLHISNNVLQDPKLPVIFLKEYSHDNATSFCNANIISGDKTLLFVWKQDALTFCPITFEKHY